VSGVTLKLSLLLITKISTQNLAGIMLKLSTKSKRNGSTLKSKA